MGVLRVKVIFAALIVGVILVQNCWCKPKNDEYTDNFKKWLKHHELLNQYKCGDTQPMEVKLTDLLKEKAYGSKFKDITPNHTVLHRCNSWECCPNGYECQPVPNTVETVNLTFAILEGPTKMIFFSVPAQNHTQCSCQIKVDGNTIK